jgi:glycosyltransferase involved in cell wall biosynthesis
MMNMVMLVKDRPGLTVQALQSLAKNTVGEWNLVVVDDQSKYETQLALRLFCHARRKQVACLRNENSKGITGQVRNLGVYWAERYWGRGDWLALADNDIAFLPGWDKRMVECSAWNGWVKVLGGARHPYHQPNKIHDGWVETDAVAGYLQMMRWETWEQYGPLDAHAPGVCQSEDHAFCRKIVEAGGLVGYIDPAVIMDCGLTNTLGQPAIGADQKPRIGGWLYE